MAETNTGGSLNKKTKAQLIDIILRKDDVERKVREDLTDKQKEVGLLKLQNTKLKEDISLYKANDEKLTGIIDNLNNDITRIKLTLSTEIDANNALCKQIKDLDGLKDVCDEQTSTIEELKFINAKKTKIIIILFIISLILLSVVLI